MISIEKNGNFEFKKILALYESVGWTAYTDDIQALKSGIENTPYYLIAYSDGEVVGFLRAVTDFNTIVYVQDLLVDTKNQHKGIGTALLERCFEDFSGVRQKILLTDVREKNVRFYESVGMKCADEYYCKAFMK